ncbi:NUDIX hydrolase [Mucilaginibacter ginsenosidivorans]|uniref:NUDIX hydrolase n=1 Tax=Mucilaginibacter ginsenosidivorans TaxID=398053 RepID=A0A5B8V0E9_9SPHI|nr:NUDIX domain-containing protein [Mucilaginibacter ginsenosidivorans]QEC64910.1 NUDIX hydrolase [Mucilaginibacter ginsenosidivorans]
MKEEQKESETNSAGSGYLPGLAIDAVIFGFHDHQLKVLLMEYKESKIFALPGGFIRADEDLNKAARRVVSERTGLQNIYLEQFYVFGDFGRSDPRPMKTIMTAIGLKHDDTHWLLQRFVTVGHYALVDFTQVTPMPDKIFDGCAWYALGDIPPLMQDHAQIVKKALESLQADLDRKLVAFNLMPAEFTMNELQTVYETILDKKLLRPAFQRKILSLGLLERIAKKWTGGAHKAPYLYKFIS